MKRLALGAGVASTGVVLFSLVSLALAGRAQDSEAPPAVQAPRATTDCCSAH
jgi:hypothetical protein